MQQSNIPIKNIIECSKCITTSNIDNTDDCTRHNFIKKCIPLIDIKNSNINILNWDKTGFLHYDPTNDETFSIDHNFMLEPSNIPTIETEYKISDLKHKIDGHFLHRPI